MALPFSACGLVIGKGGTIQKEIQEQTGITVKITPKGNNVVPNERVASLTGVTQAVTAAAAQVFRLVVADPHMGPMLERRGDTHRRQHQLRRCEGLKGLTGEAECAYSQSSFLQFLA
ncbi:unnamed protein product [Durusdinium trenchii]|uniref:K Homology domain-containing protein n=1 Tax=Durusdinium trenchii TaxID=1381693 RepID=A0ABP0NBI3_9DINO